MSEKTNKEDGEDRFAEFVSTAVRAPRQGVYEHLLSQFLASAVVVTDPLKRIKIVTEAAMMVPEREREDLAVNYETVERLNTVCMALQNARNEKAVWIEGSDAFKRIIIPWGFPTNKENFEKYISPWYLGPIRAFPLLLTHHLKLFKVWTCSKCSHTLGEVGVDEKPVKCPKCSEKLKEHFWDYKIEERYKVVKDPRWSFFFDITTCLAEVGYQELKNQFITYAIPKVQLMLAELTRLVQPNLYANILGLYTKRRSYAEKVSEVAKTATSSEDELDQEL